MTSRSLRARSAAVLRQGYGWPAFLSLRAPSGSSPAFHRRGVRLAGVFVFLLLAGCAAQEQPVGIGRGTDDYKKSPCACASIDETAPPGFWNDIRELAG